jgi:hypothetical protein
MAFLIFILEKVKMIGFLHHPSASFFTINSNLRLIILIFHSIIYHENLLKIRRILQVTLKKELLGP